MGWQDSAVPVDDSAAPPAAGGWQAQAVPVDDSTDTSDQVSRAAQSAADARQRDIANQDQVDRRIERGSPAAGEQTHNNFFREFEDAVNKTDLTNNMFVRASRYTNDLAAIWDQQNAAWQKAKAAGLTTLSVDDWMKQPGHSPEDIYIAQHGKAPELSMLENWDQIPGAIVKSITDNPGAALGNIFRGFIEDPELLVNPELGAASRVEGFSKGIGAVARAGEVGATMGAQSAAISTAQQVQEKGKVNPTAVAQSATEGAVTGMALAFAHSAPRVIVDTTKDALTRVLGLDKPGRQKFNANFADAQAQGKGTTEAFKEAIDSQGLDPKAHADAMEMADAMDEALTRAKEKPNAADQEGQQDQGSNAEGVRSQEGQERVLREREQGDDQGGGSPDQPPPPQAPSQVAPGYEDAPHYDMRPPEMKEAEAAIERARQAREQPPEKPAEAPPAAEKPAPTKELPPLEFTPHEKLNETPKSDGTVAAAELPAGKWYHTTDAPGLTVLDPKRSKPGNRFGPAVYVAKDFALSASHKPTRVKNGVLQPKGEAAPSETHIVDWAPENPFVISDEHGPGMLDRATAAKYFEKAGMMPDEIAKVLGNKPKISADTVWKELKKYGGGGDDGGGFAAAVLQDMGHDGVIAEGGRLGVSYKEVPVTQGRAPFNKQGGMADPELLARVGLAGLAATGVYALSGDKTKAVAAAAAAGLLPFARGIVRSLRLGNGRIQGAIKAGRMDTKAIFRDYLAKTRVTSYAVSQWQRATEALLTGEPDVKASMRRVRDYVQGHRDMELSPREMSAAKEVKEFLDMMGEAGKNEKVLRQLREDYLPGLYRKKPFQSWSEVYDELTQQGAFRGNYTGMSPRSRFALEKIIPDYRTVERLVAEGKLNVVPITDNPFEIAGRYGRSISKTIANKQLVDTLMKTPGPHFKVGKSGEESAVPLIVHDTPQATAQRIAQTIAIMGKQFDLPEEAMEMARKFAIVHAPKDYVRLDHPVLDGLRVHRDIADPMKLIFGTGDPGAIPKALFSSSMAAKSMLFSFSLFHAGTLLTNAAVLGLRHPFYMARGIAAARAARLDTAFRPEVARWHKAGLMLAHGFDDVDPSFAQRALEFVDRNVQRAPGGGIVALPVKAAAFLHRAINSFLWDQLHPTLKLGTAMAMSDRWAARAAMGKEKVSDPAVADRQIAQAVNDLYGGLNWFELANNVDSNVARTVATALFSPNGRRWMQTMMLAPDWNIAAVRAWTEAAKAAMPGIDAKASDHLYRTYLTMSALATLGGSYMLQKHFTGENLWDKDDWSTVDMGDGRRMQLNKHFMETVHLIAQPQRFILGKIGYLPREALEQLFSKEYVTYLPGKGGREPFTGPHLKDDSPLGRVMHAAKTFVTPISADNLMHGDIQSLVSGLVGFPIYGKTYERQREDAMDTARDKATSQGKSADTAARRARTNVDRKQREDESKRQANRRKATP